VALWRTSAVAAALALLAAGCGAAQHEASQTTTGTTPTPGKAQLAPKGQKPLTVEGTGFHPQEQVTVVAKGMQSQRVTAQADNPFRLSIRDVENLRTRSNSSDMVPLGSVATFRDTTGPFRVPRYNLFPAAEVQGARWPIRI